MLPAIELPPLPGMQHVLALWLLAALGSAELSWQFRHHGYADGWCYGVWGAVFAAVLAWAARDTERWPQGLYRASYLGAGGGGLAVFGTLWFAWGLSNPGASEPLQYLPLLNPLDLAQIGFAAAMWYWLAARRRAAQISPDMPGGVYGMALPVSPLVAIYVFCAVNAAVLRGVHHWGGVPYTFTAMMDSILAQSCLSLIWTLSALVLMWRAVRARQRRLWVCGAALLAAVVAKLFLFDLDNSGTVERIVSFMGVGLGLLAIGYLAPVPPARVEEAA